ncbi:MAG: hypothetical protein CMJ07_03175 [Pelagibacterales bacterium]|nr:hypothetical protein [Pelagibacterales bacterium]OUV27999.1 MAG: hypothetical protein CBC69_01760 [Alphaproteobacteria bacterium TMED109]|tara:strand:- start:5325 stop:5588 length:264 start_codon:yes stop_codon:yes gene_type:complete
MKKIFVIEINEKDKNIENEAVINELEQQFQEFSEKISSNKNLYIRFKRIGTTWQNILNNLIKIKKYNNIVKKEENKFNKTNHLKVVK